MGNLTLVIGNRNYSSWSLRGWLLLKQAGLIFEEVFIPIHTPDSEKAILRYSPGGLVPVLLDGNITVWESISICEYVAEQYPSARLWPEDVAARALARSVSAEMHAGFRTLRQNMPMNCRGRFPGKGLKPGVQEDIDRITAIWRDCRQHYGRGGDLLFGYFTCADAMYAPVVSRFITYDVKVDPVSKAYMDTVWSLPAMQEWVNAAKVEPYTIDELEIYAKG
jgi:glutathione S-transferase